MATPKRPKQQTFAERERANEQRLKDIGAGAYTQSSTKTAQPSRIVESEAVASRQGGGYIVRQTNTFTGETATVPVAPVPASFSDGDTRYESTSQLRPLLEGRAAVASSNKGTLYAQETDSGITITRKTRAGGYATPLEAQAFDARIAQQEKNQAIAQLSPLRVTVKDESPLAKTKRIIEDYTPFAGFGLVGAPVAKKTAEYIGERYPLLDENIKGSIVSMASTASKNIAGGQRLLEQGQGIAINEKSQAFIEASYRADVKRTQERDVRFAGLNPFEAFVQEFKERPPVITGFALEINPKNPLFPFQKQTTSGDVASEFATTYRSFAPQASDKEVANAFIVYERRNLAKKAGVESTNVFIGTGVELAAGAWVAPGQVAKVGRIAQFIKSPVGKTTIGQATRRVAISTGIGGFIEGGTQSIVEQSTFTQNFDLGQASRDAGLGALSASTISTAQFKLDLGKTSASRAGGRVFNAVVNVLDPQEPLSDALARGVQRTSRSTKIRMPSLISEPSVQTSTKTDKVKIGRTPIEPWSFLPGARSGRRGGKVKTQTELFGVSPSTRTDAVVSTKQETKQRNQLSLFTRTSTNAKAVIDVNPFVKVPTTTKTTTKTSISPRTNLTTRTNINVLTPDLPPILPLGWGSTRGSRRTRTRSVRRAKTGSLSGAFLTSFGVKGRRSDFATGLGVRF